MLGSKKQNKIRRYKTFNTFLKSISSGLKDGKLGNNEDLDMNHRKAISLNAMSLINMLYNKMKTSAFNTV